MKKKNNFTKKDLPKIITLNNFEDDRGKLSKIYSKDKFEKYLKNFKIKQINFVTVKKKGTIKGIHFQKQPFLEIKLVYLIKGKIFDAVVDVRKNSKDFLIPKTYILNSTDKSCLLIPKGYGHSFQTLTDNCEILYCHSEIYKPQKEISLNPFDPSINIRWPLKLSKISSKDKKTKFISSNFKGILI